jgi:hypothetical protein
MCAEFFDKRFKVGRDTPGVQFGFNGKHTRVAGIGEGQAREFDLRGPGLTTGSDDTHPMPGGADQTGVVGEHAFDTADDGGSRVMQEANIHARGSPFEYQIKEAAE